MFLRLVDASLGERDYKISWRLKGSWHYWKSVTRRCTFRQANAFANRMISRGYQVELETL